MIRRRTCCAYCGRRIPGALPSGTIGSGERARERRLRFAARVACRRHLDLPGLDPNYTTEAR